MGNACPPTSTSIGTIPKTARPFRTQGGDSMLRRTATKPPRIGKTDQRKLGGEQLRTTLVGRRHHGSEVFHPAAYRFIGNHDPAFSQQVLDIAEAEGEPGIQPDGLLNDYGWEAISGVADLGHDGHLRPQIPAHKPNKRDNADRSAA